MSFADLISPGLTQVAKSRTAYLSGQRQAEQEGIAASLAALKAKREAESASILDALHKAQTEKALRITPAREAAPRASQFVKSDSGDIFNRDPDGTLTPYEAETDAAGNATGRLVPKKITTPETKSVVSPGAQPPAASATPASPAISPNAPAVDVDLGADPEFDALMSKYGKSQGTPTPPAKPLPRFGQKLTTTLTPSGELTRTQDAPGVGVVDPADRAGLAKRTQAITDNETRIRQIDAIIKDLDAHPDAVGVGLSKGGIARAVGAVPGLSKIGEIATQKADSAGVGTRNKLQNVGSLMIHDRSGGAVSGPEFQRLGFVPDAAYDYQSNRQKLLDLKKFAEIETAGLREGLPNGHPMKRTSP